MDDQGFRVRFTAGSRNFTSPHGRDRVWGVWRVWGSTQPSVQWVLGLFPGSESAGASS
jgi:hypothetical protein